LEHLSQITYPVQGTGFFLRPLALAVDMQGGGATTENAYAFYRGRRKAGEGRIWYLTRGRGGDQPNRVWLSAPERTNNAKRRVASDIKILHMATDRLKDAVMASLRMQEDGQNQCIVPEWMPDTDLVELTAERRGAKGWEKRPGMVRNESLDHLVQARALHIQIGGEKMNADHPPVWAVMGLENPHVTGTAPRSGAEPETPPAPPVAGSGWIKPTKGWL
jgi:phage terminase large subunit GpA-like protein